jgi:hypothetical protein
MKLGRLRLLGRDLGHPIGRWSSPTTGLGARHDRILLVYTYKKHQKAGKNWTYGGFLSSMVSWGF